MAEIVDNHTGRAILYLLAGAATGATIALLTAPQSGRETRRKLKQASSDLANRMARIPPALHEAYRRATSAGKEAFVHSLEEPEGATPSTLQARQRQH